jgi:hypothetical protein
MGETEVETTSSSSSPLAIADAGVGGLGATGGLAFAVGDNAVALARNTGGVGGGFALAAGANAFAEGGAGLVMTAPGDSDGIALSLPQAKFLLVGDAGYYNTLAVEDEEITGGFVLGVAGAGGDTGSSGAATTDEYGSPDVVEAVVEAEAVSYAVGAGFGATSDGEIEGGAAAGSTFIGLTAGGVGSQEGEGEYVSGYGAADSKTIRYAQGPGGFAEVESTGDGSIEVETMVASDMIVVDTSAEVETSTSLDVGGAGYNAFGASEADSTSSLVVEASADSLEDEDAVAGEADSETDSDADITFETPSAYAFRSNTMANAGNRR